MSVTYKNLTFKEVDGLAYAAFNGRPFEKLPVNFRPAGIGPLLELYQLRLGDKLPEPRNWLLLNGFEGFINALEDGRKIWISPSDKRIGFIRSVRKEEQDEDQFTDFLLKVLQVGCKISGFSATISRQIVAAMKELESNIHEHAESPDTGILAYNAKPGELEFVVADQGIGVLRSLQSNEAYHHLSDEGRALEAALAEGVSRFGPNKGRGYGFNPILKGLVNFFGELRFRSGDHALAMDGTHSKLATAQISQKAPIDGFLASIKCYKI